MSDTRDETSTEPNAQSRPTARTTAQSASETAQVSGAAADTRRRSAEAPRQGDHGAAQTAQHSGEAAAATMQHFGEIAEGASRRAMQLFAEGQQQFVQNLAERLEATRHEMAEAAQVGAQNLRTLSVLPNVVGGTLRDLQQGMVSIFEGLIRSNLDAAREQLRFADGSAFARLQQRAVHNYMNALIEGGAILTRSIHSAADRTLGALEQQLESRREGRAEGQRHDRRNGCVGDVMHRDTRLINPDDTVQQVARLMRDEDTGVLPVGEGDRLVGIALVLAAAPAVAQTPSPTPTNPPVPVAPPNGRSAPPERIAPSSENLTDGLSQQKGTIAPPNVDSGMQVNPPQNSRTTMPVVRPPGSSGENRSVVPK